MEGGRRAGRASDGDEKEGARRRASFHADQHGQPGVDVLESRAMEGGRRAMEGGQRAVCASDGDECETVRVLGAEHPSTLTIMANLASTYRNQGRWKEAEGLVAKVIGT